MVSMSKSLWYFFLISLICSLAFLTASELKKPALSMTSGLVAARAAPPRKRPPATRAGARTHRSDADMGSSPSGAGTAAAKAGAPPYHYPEAVSAWEAPRPEPVGVPYSVVRAAAVER